MKKNKKIIVVFLLLITLSLTGCTHYVKDDNNQIVKEKTTGQSLASDILCMPTDKNVLKTYEDNNVDLTKLPKCKDFTPASGGYEGLWTTLFIKPLSWFICKMGELFGNYGFSIILVTILIRLIIFPLSKKAAMQSEGMKDAQKDLAKLEKKYKNKQSQDDQMMKAQEMMAIYKKYGINPVSGCLFAFIQMPLFLAFLESLNKLPVVFEGTFLGLNLGTSPFVAFSSGHYLYLLLPILVALTTYFSFKLNSAATGSEQQQKQMKLMMNIMIVFIIVASFTMSSSIIIYWITGSIFTIVQNLFIKRRKKNVKN